MKKNYLNQLLKVAAAILLLLSFQPEAVQASHFRYGHLTWRPAGGNTASFTMIDAFRRNGYGSPMVGDIITETIGGTTLFFGDGTNTGTLRYKVLSIDIANNWLVAVALEPGSNTKTTIDHTYSGPTAPGGGPWLAEINSAARTGIEINNPNGWYRVLTYVELNSGNSSPSSSLPPIVVLPQSATASFFVPGADPDPNTNLVWRLATGSEAANGSFNQPAGLTVNPATGLVTWNTLGAVLGGLYSCQIVIEDRDATTNALKTQVAVDFLIEISTCDPANTAPVFSAANPACGSTIPATVGQAVQFNVDVSDADVGDNVSLNSAGIPGGAIVNPGLPTSGNPASTQFSWIPTSADVGPHVISFFAFDDCGLQTICSYTILVSNCNLSVDAGQDEESYFGYSADQTITRTPTVSGGTAPFSYQWTLNRALLCNQINSSGDELFYGGSCTDNICPTTGSLATAPVCSGNATITAVLMQNAEVCVTVTDANGCVATDCFNITAFDARCFAGNSSNVKVKVCHRTSSTSNKYVQICIDENALPAHLANNPDDYVGKCRTRRLASGASGWISDNIYQTIESYPNPFNYSCTIKFALPGSGNVTLKAYNTFGQEVAVLYEGFAEEETIYDFVLDGNDLPAGLYFVNLVSGTINYTHRIQLLK